MSLASHDKKKNKPESPTSRQPNTTPPILRSKKKPLIITFAIMIALTALTLILALTLTLRIHPTHSQSTTTWPPPLNSTFNYQLSVIPTSSDPHGIAIWFIDLFAATSDLITGLQSNGARVVCYFSAGSSENWRPDFDQFRAADLGNDLKDWAGERWVDTRSESVRGIMVARMDQAAAKKCDGIDPDNVDVCKSIL